MSEKMYNLQVPIPVELANKLKALAKEDDRTLRVFCRRLLQLYVDNYESEYNYTEDEIIENVVKTENLNKKKKVGALRPPTK